MKTTRAFINGVLEAGNWDIRDAFCDIRARDTEHDAEKATLRNALARAEQRELAALGELDEARADNAEVRAYATRLEAALERAHSCPTVRDDGECDGCYVSETLATCPSAGQEGPSSGREGKEPESESVAAHPQTTKEDER